MLVDIIGLLKYPVSNPKRFLVAALINIVWFFLVPMFFVNGYLVKVIRSTIQGEKELPAWDDWKDILKHGFFVTLIIAIYFLIPMVLAYGASALGNLPPPSQLTTESAMPDISPVTWVLMLLSLVSFIFVIAILPMIILVYSASENIKQAFNVPMIIEKIMANVFSYLKAYALSTGIYIIFILLLPLATFAAGFVMVYPGIFFAHVFAKSFKEVI